MENTSSIIKIIIITFIIIGIIIGTVFYFIEKSDSIKEQKITKENINIIKEKINNSNEITLQEKINFNNNYLMYGNKIIGYKVKEVIKKIEY